MGVCSLHPERGITTTSQDEAHLKQMMIRQAGKAVALADARKLNRTDHYKLGELSMIDTLITDLNPEDELLTSLVEHIPEIF
jgi:DeoR/GlpR family transcriptional regulator of sugar metabolism